MILEMIYLTQCLSIKRDSNKNISKDNITLSSSSHDIKLNSGIKDKPLINYNDLKSVDDIPSNSYFYDSISISEFETSFYKYVAETNKEIYKIDSEVHHNNCNIMKNTYRKLTKYFKSHDTCCTSSEQYLKYIVSELTI